MGTSSCEVLSLTVWDFSATGARLKPQDSHFASPEIWIQICLPALPDLARPLVHVSQASPPLVSGIVLTNIFLQCFFFFWQGRGVHPALVSKLNREAFGIAKRNLNNFVTPKIV